MTTSSRHRESGHSGNYNDSLASERKAALDYLIELQALYLSMRDRIDLKIEAEKKAGVPDWSINRDMEVVCRLIDAHGKAAKDLGIL